MNEIKKAIETLQGECGCVELDLSNSNAGEKAQEFAEACHIAVQALHEKAERENPKPLTIDELREMDGELVWVESDECGMWYRTGEAGSSDIRSLDGRLTTLEDTDYGKTWLVYRTKPEGSGEK